MRRRFARAALLVPLALALSGVSSIEALFAPGAEPWPRWERHDPAGPAAVDHGDWQRFLDAYVRPDGGGSTVVDYAGVGTAGRAALDAYIARLEALSIGAYPRAVQRAYWINLYNALTVQVVLDQYPVSSIRDIDISPGVFADGPWRKKLVMIEGEPLSLDDIEHRILRPIWRDPRVHYAVNCAAVGCPALLPTAFTAANTERLLEDAARRFVNHPRGASVERGALAVSSIYVWFQEDFGGSEAAVIKHLRRYAAPPLAEALGRVSRIHDHGYDWRLNDARAPSD